MLVRGVDNLAVFCILPYNLSLPLVAVTAWIHYGCAVMSFRWHLIASNDVSNVALFDHRRQDRLTTCHVLPALITASVGRTRQWCSVSKWCRGPFKGVPACDVVFAGGWCCGCCKR
jgi:hypothetical protein